MTIRHFIRAAVASVAVVGGGLTAMAAPAGATVIDTDSPWLEAPQGTEVQFGGPFDFLEYNTGIWRPNTGGALSWDLTSGTITPRLYGSMYTQDIGGRCAKMRIYYYRFATDGNGDPIPGVYSQLTARSSTPECPNDDDWYLDGVDISPYSHPDIVAVKVATTLEDSNGRFVDTDSAWYFLD